MTASSGTLVVPRSRAPQLLFDAAYRSGFRIHLHLKHEPRSWAHSARTGCLIFYGISKQVRKEIHAWQGESLTAYSIPGFALPPVSARASELESAVAFDADEFDIRRKFAEAIASADPERSRFIRLQLDLDDAHEIADPDTRVRASLHEARQLLAKNRERWAHTLYGITSDCVFRRGFVELVRVKARTFIDLGELMLLLAPIQHLDVEELAEPDYERFFHSRALRCIRSLALSGLGLIDRAIEMLATSPYAGALRWLSLRGNPLTESSVATLARSRRLPHLRWVDLRGTEFAINEVVELSDGTVLYTRDPDQLRSFEERLGERVHWLRFPSPPRSWAHLSPDRFRLRAPSSPAYGVVRGSSVDQLKRSRQTGGIDERRSL